MNIAFYSPIHAPTSAKPSGDRFIAQLFMQALTSAGHHVDLASRFRSYDREGDAKRQRRIKELGARLAERVIRRYKLGPDGQAPDVWVTYFLYHRAPDWLGPVVSAALDIPYVVIGPSHAPKQEDGPWDLGFQAAGEALSRADLVLGFDVDESQFLLPLLKSPAIFKMFLPFIDVSQYAGARDDRQAHRRELAETYGLDDAEPWLLTVAMMRPGDKVQSYEVLGSALKQLLDKPWRLIVVGGGSAEEQVRAALGPLAERVIWVGEQPHDSLPPFYAASDVFLWPSVKEMPGMVFLESQASGTPVVGGRAGGVPAIVEDGLGGRLAAPMDADDFARATAELLSDTDLRRSLGDAAHQRVSELHGVNAAGAKLDQLLGALV